jgi:polar amino acid transport system substrate-binding protein
LEIQMSKQNLLRLTALLGCLVLTLMLSVTWITADATMQGDVVPTLVPPTLVPVSDAGTIDALPSESGVARIMRDGKVRVGILFNEPKFGELGARCCDVLGFDADLARAIAESWGVTLEGIQVTRQTGVDLLVSGQIDLLIAAQPHLRSLDSRVEFSQAYYPGAQSILVRDGDGATELSHFADRIVGVVVGTRAEQAVTDWISRANYTVNVRTFYTMDQAVGALRASEIDGVVNSQHRLSLLVHQPSDGRIVEEPVRAEPFAIGVRRQDVNLRNAVNHTLQFLYQSGQLNEIHKVNFNGTNYPDTSFITWGNVGAEAPRLDQFGADVPLPTGYVVPRLQTERQIRVAGLTELPEDTPESRRRADQLNRLLVNAMASRWQVTVIDVADNGQNPLDLVANGEADLAVGVGANWDAADQVDFTGYYLQHGLRMMVEANSNSGTFGDLRGKWIGVFADDSGARDIIQVRARAENVLIDDIFSILREQDAAFGMLVENNYDAVMGDSLRLIPHVQAEPDLLRLTTLTSGEPIWYSRSYVSMAVPRNDIDFRLLVEYTLQELARDGTLASFLAPVMMPNDIPRFEIWPGSSQYLGYNLAGE